MLDALPGLGAFEIRLGHLRLLEVLLRTLLLPKEVAPSAMQLLKVAATTSPAAAEPGAFPGAASAASASAAGSAGRQKLWPGIKAGLVGLGLGPESVARCRQGVVLLPGEIMCVCVCVCVCVRAQGSSHLILLVSLLMVQARHLLR